MKHLESFRFVLFHKVRALEDERSPLEEQVNMLKTNVSDMYNEFVREFQHKQQLSSDFHDKKNLAVALQEENVKYRAQIIQLKKDGRRLLQEVEQILHPDTCVEFEKMPMTLAAVLEKHQHLAQWMPPKEDEVNNQSDPFADNTKESQIIEEMKIQRDLLFRKNQIAVAAASQSKREGAQDVRRLTSENAQLIAEMNTLRNERKSWQRSFKQMEAKIMAMEAESSAKQRLGQRADAAPAAGQTLTRATTAPGDISPSNKGPPQKGRKPMPASAVADTPYVRRKVVDQQEVFRRNQQKGKNQLPPVNSGSAATGAGSGGRPTNQEKRFTQSLVSMDQGRQHMERQGFDVGSLTSQAQAIASSALPLTRIPSVPAADPAEAEAFVDAEAIQAGTSS